MSFNDRNNTDTNFTNVVFDDVKKKLITKMKSHYPNAYSDFNKSSFGSMMVDLISMMSEQLGFYTQFVANENYPQTARSSYSLNYHAQTAGKPVFNAYTSAGIIKIITHLPVNNQASGPDTRYTHSILKGTKFQSITGGQFTSTEDVTTDFSEDKSIGTVFSEDGGGITYYSYEIDIPVVSGEERSFSITVPEYQKFLKIEIKDVNVTEVLKVLDSAGNEYYRVENLSQNVIYRALPDSDFENSQVSSKLVPFPVPRRYMVEYEGDKIFLVFGYGSEESLKVRPVADPSQIALLRPGQDYIYDTDFDPAKLLSTDKFGVSPQNTVLEITYRANTVENTNAAANSTTSVSSLKLSFDDSEILQQSNRQKIDFIRNNISCENPEPINGNLDFESTQELSQAIHAAKKAQSRAVTAHDYETVAYLMPSSFGSVKRVSVSKDRNELTRNLNMFVIAEDAQGKLEKCSEALKQNLKTWVNEYRMISDSIDIFDAKILNLGIEFDVSLKRAVNPVTSVSSIRNELFREINLITPQIGQHFSIGFVEEVLNSISIISRVNKVKIVTQTGKVGYSNNLIDIKSHTSLDGGAILVPHDTIWEVKFKKDIKGKVS
tara:strand:- start:1250 stop:3064 length:1815 start_codon:yes stop_codon:yes gene_type:complete